MTPQHQSENEEQGPTNQGRRCRTKSSAAARVWQEGVEELATGYGQGRGEHDTTAPIASSELAVAPDTILILPA